LAPVLRGQPGRKAGFKSRSRPGPCPGGAFACWHSAWPSSPDIPAGQGPGLRGEGQRLCTRSTEGCECSPGEPQKYGTMHSTSVPHWQTRHDGLYHFQLENALFRGAEDQVGRGSRRATPPRAPPIRGAKGRGSPFQESCVFNLGLRLFTQSCWRLPPPPRKSMGLTLYVTV